MASETYTLVNYGKKYKSDFKALLTGGLTHIRLPDEIDGVNTTLVSYTLAYQPNLTEIDFNNCTVIPPYCAYNDYNVETTTLNNPTQIGSNAFNSCGAYVSNPSFNITAVNPVTIGTDAFSNSSLTSFKGPIQSIGVRGMTSQKMVELDVNILNGTSQQAFASNSAKKFKLKIQGAAEYSSFSGMQWVEDFEFDPDSNITDLGQQAFSSLGASRPTTNQKQFIMDMTNSSYKTMASNSFAYCKNAIFIFPSTVTHVYSNILNQTSDVTALFNSIPTAQAAPVNSASNLTILLNPEYDVNTFKAQTYWTICASSMYNGMIGLPTASTLPSYTTQEGLALMWYTDKSHTITTTTVASNKTPYYAERGSARVVWHVTKKLKDSSVSVTDGSNTYDEFIPINSTVTITPSPTDSNKTVLYSLTINNIDYTTSGAATITVTEDVNITAIYWDGVHLPLEENLADNSWELIKAASKANQIPSTWKVGDTKSMTYGTFTFSAILVDKTGKYTRTADGTPAYLTFESDSLIPGASSGSVLELAYGSQYNSSLLTNLNTGTLSDNIDATLKTNVEAVDISIGDSTATTTTTESYKFFFPREGDLWQGVTPMGYSSEYSSIVIDEYYQDQTGGRNTKVSKKVPGSTSIMYQFWCMSPAPSNQVVVGYNSGGYSARNRRGVSQNYSFYFRFAL